MSTHYLCSEKKYKKYQNFLSGNFHLLVVKFSVYLNRHVFVMFAILPYKKKKKKKNNNNNNTKQQWSDVCMGVEAGGSSLFISLKKTTTKK